MPATSHAMIAALQKQSPLNSFILLTNHTEHSLLSSLLHLFILQQPYCIYISLSSFCLLLLERMNVQCGIRSVDLFLRFLILPLTTASCWVMVRNKQYSDGYGKVEFNNLSGFKYLVCINVISAGYAFASLAFSFFYNSTKDWLLYLFDQVLAYLMVTSMSTVVELLYLAHEGDVQVSWSSACNYYEKFCNRAHVSLALHVIAMVCFLVLSLISAYRTFSKFDAPSFSPKETQGQEEYME